MAKLIITDFMTEEFTLNIGTPKEVIPLGASIVEIPTTTILPPLEKIEDPRTQDTLHELLEEISKFINLTPTHAIETWIQTLPEGRCEDLNVLKDNLEELLMHLDNYWSRNMSYAQQERHIRQLALNILDVLPAVMEKKYVVTPTLHPAEHVVGHAE